MTTLTTLPVYAPPGRDVKVIFALTGTGSNFIRVWVTAAPPGSELRAKIDESTQNRFKAHEGDGGADHPWQRAFGVGGKYTLVTQEYTRGASTHGGGYQNSPDGAPSETKVGSEVTLSLFIGQRMTAEISAGPDALKVITWVWDATIRATTRADHGEATPAIEVISGTAKALAASEADLVVAALADLVDATVSSVVGDLAAVFADLVAKWFGHNHSGVHNHEATDNDLPTGLASASDPASIAGAITEMLPRIRQHYINDGVGSGLGVTGRDSVQYHKISSVSVNDNRNLPLVAGASGLSDAYWAVADIWRSIAAHVVNTGVHLASDAANTPADLPALLNVGRCIFDVLASSSPATPSAQSVGAMLLIAGAGFAETPL